jgi:hypothetical protein
MLTTAAMSHHEQSNFGKKGFIGFFFSTITVHYLRKSGQEPNRNLETGADAEAMEKCCLLACSTWLAQPAFL